MAGRHVKLEFSPAPGKNIASFAATASSFEPTPSLPVPEWKSYNENDRMKRLDVKEAAAKNGEASLKEILGTLKTHLRANPSCQPRIDKIETILQRKKDFQVYVGFLGATGSGKTYLINSLIGYPGLLPSSDEQACTAVVVEVAYNPSEEENPPFHAEIVYVTKGEWREELEQIIADLTASPTQDDSDDGETDIERRDRMKTTYDKLRIVYPHLTSIDKLKSSTVEELLNHADVRRVLNENGFVKSIEEVNRLKFTNAITSHIASGDPDSGMTAFWPLVRLVKIFVKTPILAGGIILVDLPGNSDSNSARSSVAERYQRRFAKTCIVSDARRAMSEQNAHDLLEKTAKRNLQLDGLYKPESLCFVITQNDREFNLSGYLKSHPNMQEKYAEDERNLWDSKDKLAALRIAETKAIATHEETSRLIAVATARLSLVKQLLEDASLDGTSVGQKRKRGNGYSSELSDAEMEEHNALMDEKIQLQDKLHDLRTRSLSVIQNRIASNKKTNWHSHSNIWTACVRNRNRTATTAIIKDFDATLKELGRKSTGDLQVFCVSARIHLYYLWSTKTHPAFPTKKDTQVPALREWLISSTLDTRERYAQAFLDDAWALLTSMLPWIYNKFGEMKMTIEERARLEPQLKKSVNELQDEFSHLTRATLYILNKAVKTKLYGTFPDARRVAAAQAPGIAKGWCRGMAWGTHRALNKKQGVHRDSKGRQHNWNEDLCDAMMNPKFKQAWDVAFFQKFPAERDLYTTKGQEIITAFANTVAVEEVNPDIKDGLEALKDGIMRSPELLKNRLFDAFESITKKVQDSHRLATPAMKEYLGPMYEKCGSESGKGHYGRNKATHQEKMKADGISLFKAANKTVKASLNTLLDDLPLKFQFCSKSVVDAVSDEIQLFFDRNTTDDFRGTQKVISQDKLLLQAAIISDISRLSTAWNSEVPALKEPAIDDQDLEREMNDSIFRDISKDGITVRPSDEIL